MASETIQDILGAGWSFPVQVDRRGGISISEHEIDIEESIRVILGTSKGERRMRPNFGCEIHDLVFAPNSEATWALASRYVQEALGWWEPRIEVTSIDCQPDYKDTSRLLINIQYLVKATNDKRNLVYPFIIFSETE